MKIIYEQGEANEIRMQFAGKTLDKVTVIYKDADSMEEMEHLANDYMKKLNNE